MMSIFSYSYWFPTEEEVRSRIAYYEEAIHLNNAWGILLDVNLEDEPEEIQYRVRGAVNQDKAGKDLCFMPPLIIVD
jgi:hypothetical protein